MKKKDFNLCSLCLWNIHTWIDTLSTVQTLTKSEKKLLPLLKIYWTLVELSNGLHNRTGSSGYHSSCHISYHPRPIHILDQPDIDPTLFPLPPPPLNEAVSRNQNLSEIEFHLTLRSHPVMNIPLLLGKEKWWTIYSVNTPKLENSSDFSSEKNSLFNPKLSSIFLPHLDFMIFWIENVKGLKQTTQRNRLLKE